MKDENRGHLSYVAPAHVPNKIWKESDDEPGNKAQVCLHNMQFKFVFINVSEGLLNIDLKRAVFNTLDTIPHLISTHHVPVYQCGFEFNEKENYKISKHEIGRIHSDTLKYIDCGFLSFYLLDLLIFDSGLQVVIPDMVNFRNNINMLCENSNSPYGLLPNTPLLDWQLDLVIDLKGVTNHLLKKVTLFDFINYGLLTPNNFRNTFLKPSYGVKEYHSEYMKLYTDYYEFKDVRFVTTDGMSIVELATINTKYE